METNVSKGTQTSPAKQKYAETYGNGEVRVNYIRWYGDEAFELLLEAFDLIGCLHKHESTLAEWDVAKFRSEFFKDDPLILPALSMLFGIPIDLRQTAYSKWQAKQGARGREPLRLWEYLENLSNFIHKNATHEQSKL